MSTLDNIGMTPQLLGSVKEDYVDCDRGFQKGSGTSCNNNQIGERQQKRAYGAQKTFEERLVNLCSDRE